MPSIINNPHDRATNLVPDSRRTPRLSAVAGTVFLQDVIGFGSDLIAHVPKLFIKKVLHPLMQYFHRRSHRAHHASTDNPLRQFEVVKTKQVDAFIKIEQPFGHIM